MAPEKRRDRAKEFDDLLKPEKRDVDPEGDDNQPSDSEEESDSSVNASRDHYVDVGKSKLRKPKEIALGPQYRGTKVSRSAVELDSDDENDPFSKGFSSGSSEDESDDRGVEFESSGDEDVEQQDYSDGSLESETDNTDLSEEEDGITSSNPLKRKAISEDDRAELRKMMATEQKAVAATISQATQADAQKGRAVKRQRKCFDSLLNARIKLQKTLVAANTIVATEGSNLQDEIQTQNTALEAAETAAFNLWSNLSHLRENLVAERNGGKRKNSSFNPKTSSADLWKYLQALEVDAVSQRNATLQKWSVKARGAAALPQRGKLNNTATEATIVDVLQENLNAPDRLLKKAHTPRSCAPLQLSQKATEDERIYDDADFYGLLLKELLEQRSADSIASANVMGMDFGRMRREAKTKKNVDTKASKGRKLRYTVHEKLQNFMAPENRGIWAERQMDDLFGSLFGQKTRNLEEDEGVDGDLRDGNGVDTEDAGMLMFGK